MRIVTVGLLIVLSAMLASGCSLFGGGTPEATLFAENRTYVHWLASSQEECDELNDQGINCFQMAEFFTDGTAEIMLTDVVHQGSYQIFDGTELVITLEENPELPSEITFVILDDGAQLRNELDDSVWDREPSFAHLPQQIM